MSKILKRPMFKMGGNINSGIISNFERQNGAVIDNQPLTESNVIWRTPQDNEIMKSLLFKNIIKEN